MMFVHKRSLCKLGLKQVAFCAVTNISTPSETDLIFSVFSKGQFIQRIALVISFPECSDSCLPRQLYQAIRYRAFLFFELGWK